MQAHQQQNSNNKSSQPDHQHDIGDSGAQPPRLTKITSTKNTICLPTKIKNNLKFIQIGSKKRTLIETDDDVKWLVMTTIIPKIIILFKKNNNG